MENIKVTFHKISRVSAVAVFLGACLPAGAIKIIPTYDSTILTAANSEDIQNCIKNAIATFEPLFTDNVTVSIYFRYAAAGVGGSQFGAGQHLAPFYIVPYSTVVGLLKDDSTTGNDLKAVSNLPLTAPAPNVLVNSANGRALGVNTPGALDAQGGLTGSFDGIVTLNSTAAFQFARAGGIGKTSYDAQQIFEHEIDEVLGLGSVLDVGSPPNTIRLEDLFRYSRDSGAAALSLDNKATATSYFSLDGGATSLVSFNQNATGDFGDWLSPTCSAQTTTALVQYAFSCVGTTSDVSATSVEGIALDAIGYDLAVAPAGPPSILSSGVAPVFAKVTTIQPGAWASIYGSNLASVSARWKGDFPTQLGGTTVTVNNKPAYLWFVSPGQINFQAPDDTAFGPVDVVVTTAAGSAVSGATLAPASPSFSLLDGSHVAAIIQRPDGSGTYGSGATSYDIIGPAGTSLGFKTVAAKAGDAVVLYGVGFGPTNPGEPAGQAVTVVGRTTNQVTLEINGKSITPGFSGIVGAGLYQINLTLPAGIGTGEVGIVATVAGIGVSTQPGVVLSLQ